MKCEHLTRDGTVCGADLSPTEEHCANCDGKVEIDESKSKKCPRCSKRLSLKDNFCSGCGFSFENETKKIICEGKKKDGTKCNEEMPPSNKFCPACGTSLRKEDGNGKPISHEPSAEGDKPEKRGLAVVCSHSKFIHKTHKLQPRDSASDDHAMMKSLWDLYGCHVIDFMDQENNFYETELIDTIEKELGIIKNIEIFVFVLSSHGEEKEEKRLRTGEKGSHGEEKEEKLLRRDEQGSHGEEKEEKLIRTGEQGSHGEEKEEKLLRRDEQGSHGEEKEEKLLRRDEQGSHGEEKEKKKKGTYQHYFFTKNGQRSTQDLMKKIANITQLKKKMKIFVIQACRSRVAKDKQTVGEDKNEDRGVEIEFKKGSDLSRGQNDDIVHRDGKGNTPHEDEKNNEPDAKRQNNGKDFPDTGGYMPEAHDKMENKVENSSSDFDLPPVSGVLPCDNCVVIYASMSGKYAYSTYYDMFYSGGWLIRSVHKILNNYKKGDKAHILDILVKINREVGIRESVVERKSWKIPNLEIKMENLQLGLKNHINKLLEICSKHSSKVEIKKCQDELDKLDGEIDQNGHTKDSLKRIKDDTVLLTEKLRYVTLKAQSSFIHNLAFDEEDLFLCKMK